MRTLLTRMVPRPLHLAANLFRGSERRHTALARIRPRLHRARWRWKRLREKRPMVLVGMVEHLGDVVAAEPVARYLREQHPEARVVWAVRDSYRELIDSNPHIDEALPVGCLTEWLGLRESHAFDWVVELQIPGRACERCQVTLAGDAQGHGITLANYYHHGNLLRIFCAVAGLPPLDGGPQVYIPPVVRERVNSLGLPSSFVAIHCTSNQPERDWTAPRWRELVEQLVASGSPVVEVGLRPVVEGMGLGYTNLCGTLSILQTAEVIRRARAFVGIDSGPAHLANAVGTPGVILLGHYGPYRRRMPYSGPYADGSNATVVQWEGPSAEIPIERVLAALQGRMAKEARLEEPEVLPGDRPDARQRRREAAPRPTES